MRSAIGFLTILPVAPRDATGGLASARAWFPVVGLILGGFLVGADLLMRFADSMVTQGDSTLPPLLSAAVLTVLLVVLTRALHLDGFMDCCDALFGGFDRRRRLEILRDPHVGAFAVTGVVGLLLLKASAILALPQEGRLWILLLFPCLSRWGVVLAMGVFPYVRSRGIGTPFLEGGGGWQTASALFVTVIAALVIAGVAGLALAAAASAVAWCVGAWASRQLGGVTGDVYGAVIEVSEVAVLLVGVFLSPTSMLGERVF